ncbi:MAG: hypothetical protein ACFFCZ_17255 [Promethearchaeota archaeon]
MQERTFPGTISYPPSYSQILNDLFDALQSPPTGRYFEIQSPGDFLSAWLIRDLLEILGFNLSNLHWSSLLPKPEQTVRFNLMVSNATKIKEGFLIKGELITESQNNLQEDPSSYSNRNNHLSLDNVLLKQFWGQPRFPQPEELVNPLFWAFRVIPSVKSKHFLAYQPFFRKLQTQLSLLPNLYVIVFTKTPLPLDYDHKYQLHDFSRAGLIQLLQSWCTTYLLPEVWEDNAIVRIVDYVRAHCNWGHFDVSINALLGLIGVLRREQQYLIPETVEYFLPQIDLPYFCSDSED